MPATKRPNGLTERQERFCKEYVIDLNGLQAAIRAGYAKANAGEQAYQLLANPKVAAYLAKHREKYAKKIDLTTETLVKDLCDVRDICLGRKPFRKSMVVDDNTVEVEMLDFNPAGANKAIELLGKHLGMFTDAPGVNISGSNVQVNFAINPVKTIDARD